MTAFLTLVAIGVGVFLALRLVAKRHGRIREDARAAAQGLKLRSVPELGGGMLEELDTYRGVVDGVEVLVRAGTVAVEAPGADVKVPVASVLVAARLPEPLPYALRIAKAGAAGVHAADTGDAEFDRTCGVATDRPAAARRLLADATLRDAVLAFFAHRRSNPEITEESVLTRLYEGRHVSAALRQAVGLARRLSSTVPPRAPG